MSSPIQSAYDQWAEVYDTNENPTRDTAGRALRAAALPVAGRRVLEIGCGTGLNTGYLAEAADAVVGVDFSPGMLERARKRVEASNVTFHRADVTQSWTYADASFGGIVAMLVLEHVENLDALFAEAARVLRPGGWLYLAELHPVKQYLGSQAKYNDADTGDECMVNAYLHPVSETVNAALDAGLQVTRLWDVHAPGEPLPRIFAARFEYRVEERDTRRRLLDGT